MTRRWIATLALAALAGAACGGESSGPATAGTAARGESDPEDALLEHAECMREHGIDFPDPEIGEDGMMRVEPAGDPADFDSEEMRTAQEACNDLLPQMEEPTEEEKAALEDAMLEFTDCMRDHGIDAPDPSDGPVVRIGGDMDPDDPEFRAAQEACGHLLPGMAGES